MRPVCLITGGSGKLGTALTGRLAAEHSTVLVYNAHEPAGFSQLKQRIGPAADDEREPFAVQADLRNRHDQRRLIEVTLARYGRIDVIVNAAADTRFHGGLLDLAFADQAELGQLDLNCIQPLRLVSLIHHEFWKHDPVGNARMNRCVINVSSISGLHVFADTGQAFYAASKAALNHLTRFLANELKAYSVRANAVCPSRFPDSVPTSRVVDTVAELIAGRDNGQIIEVSRSKSQNG